MQGVEFRRTRQLLTLIAVTLVIAPAWANVQNKQLAAKPKNILFIVSDDLNTRLGSFGVVGAQTPSIDRLARQGVTFQKAYSQFPLCNPSRASFLTGLRPNTLRVYDLQTAVRGNSPKVPLGIAFAYREDEGADEEQTDGKVATEAIKMINAHSGKPFFIAVGFYRPHVPEVAPKRYFDLHPLDGAANVSEPRAGLDSLLPAANGPFAQLGRSLPPASQKKFIQSYRAAVSFMDAQVGRVLDALERTGKAQDTIIVFLSDHGFSLGEHGQWQKISLWDEVTRVPLIIYAPDQAGNGRVSQKIVELIDVFPTLTQLSGLPTPQSLEGKSLTALLARPNAEDWNEAAQSQTFAGRSVRFENWRYTVWRDGKGGTELYDLAKDPNENHNLASDPAYASVIARLTPMLPGPPPPSTAPRIPSVE